MLWIAEQVPGKRLLRHGRAVQMSTDEAPVVTLGLVATMDVTSVLATKGFWPSFNIAYIPEIYSWSGYPGTACFRSVRFARQH